jgi:protein O-mannosyl-transferase
MDRNPNRTIPFIVCLILAIITFAVFYQVHSFKFITLDDPDYVSGNPNIQTGITFKAIKWAFETNRSNNWHPLTWISHMLDWQLFGPNPAGHHLINLFFHIVNTLLLFLVLKRMTSEVWASAFAAALFALHPLHVESVAWVAERKDVLSTFFWMLTMLAYVYYVKRPNIARYLSVILFFALGLMAKPMLVTLPFVLLLLDYWPLERFGKRTIFYLIREKIPFIVLSAVSSIITLHAQKVLETNQISLNIRIANAFSSYLNYIGKMIWPGHLAIFYPHYNINLLTPQALTAALLIAGIFVFVIFLARKRKYLIVGWLWYLGTLVPAIGLIQVGNQAMADRYTYIPLTGLFIIITWGSNDLLSKWKHRKIVLAISAAAVLGAMAVCAWLQTGYWRSSTSLFEHAIAVTKNNYLAHQCLAEVLREQGKNEQAIEQCYKAMQISSNFVPTYISLGAALIGTGKSDEAIKYLTKAIQLYPKSGRAYEELGWAMVKKGKMNEAITLFEKAITLEPDNLNLINNVAWYLSTYNDDKIRNPAEALQLAKRACELTNYKKPEVLDTLGVAYALANDFSKAIETTQKALELCKSPEQKKLKEEIQNRLALYKAGKPYIEKQDPFSANPPH